MNEVDQIKDSIDIVEFVRQYVELQKAGANWKGLCPFHAEKTPSFMVSADKQIFKCFGCFPKGSLVITDSGYKPIEKIKIGDNVLTHRNKFRKVKFLYKREYKRKNIQVVTRNDNQSIDMTSEHKLFAIKTKNCKQKSRLSRLCQKNCSQDCPTKYFRDYKLEKVKASDLSVGDYLIYPVNTIVKDYKKIKIFDYQKYKNKRKRIKTGFLTKKFPGKIKSNSDFLKLLGYWIAEGSIYPRGVRFSLGSHEEDFALEIKSLIKKVFNLEATLHFRKRNKSGIEISVSNNNLCEVFTNLCGKGAQNKKIPQVCMNLPYKKQKILLEAILKGDGTISKKQQKSRAGRKSITTISKGLSRQICDLLLRCNFIPSTYWKKGYIDKNNVKHKDSWSISWMPDLKNYYCNFYQISGVKYWALPIKKITKYNFYDKVYNLMVEKDHSYIVDHISVGNCGEGGDVFEFLMKIENLTFPEALEMLADRTGIKLPQFNKKSPKKYQQEKDEKSAIFKINNLSTKVFNKILMDHKGGKIAREYLKKRKITKGTIQQFMIGYAPQKRILEGFLLKRGFSRAEIRKAGNPDKFFKRIVFPIYDRMGNTVAFTGRTIKKDVEPKYLNTPETPIFHKSKTLYGLNFARESIRKEGYVILVEGQMDVVLSHQAEVKNVIATSGTALTSDHFKILARYGADVAFCFDRDVAGELATKKAIKMAYEVGVSPYVVSVPQKFKDVGEIVEADPVLWQKVSKNRKPALEWLVEVVFSEYKKEITADDKKKISKELVEYLSLISDPMEVKYYKKMIASRLAVTERIIDEVIERFRHKFKRKSNDKFKKIIHEKISEEEYLIGLVLSQPKFIDLFLKNLSERDFYDRDIKSVYKAINDCYNLSDKKSAEEENLSKTSDCIEKKISKDLGEKVKFFILEAQEKTKNIDEGEIEQEFSDYIAKIKRKTNKKIKEDFARLIAQAEEAKDIKKVKKLLKKFQEKISSN